MSLKEKLLTRTDVTCIGYSSYLADNMLAASPGERVCVEVADVPKASRVKHTSAVVGFPFGNPTKEEIKLAILNGAKEVDIPIPIRIASMNHLIRPGIFSTPQAIHDWTGSLYIADRSDVLYKFILHTDLIQKLRGDRAICFIKLLADSLRSKLSAIYHQDQVIIKTSTGYGPGGATPEVVEALVRDGHRVKASGGIRTPDAAQSMFDAGAELLGIGYSSFMNIISVIGDEDGASDTEGGNQE